MTIQGDLTLRNVTGIEEHNKARIYDFLQGAVYCWCKNRKHEWFALRDLMGGDNFFWEGTPLIKLYEKHENCADDPVKEAGKDAGWMLKELLAKDKRAFETKVQNLVRYYRWAEKPENR